MILLRSRCILEGGENQRDTGASAAFPVSYEFCVHAQLLEHDMKAFIAAIILLKTWSRTLFVVYMKGLSRGPENRFDLGGHRITSQWSSAWTWHDSAAWRRESTVV